MARITMREAISSALWEEMERDENVFIMGEEVGVWGGTYAVTKGFYDHFGEKRVRDTPIAEAVIIGAAIGAALTGLRPVAELMTINFAFAAMDHIVNEAAKLRYMFGGQFTIPMVIRTPAGGGRQLGATHSQTPDAIFAHFPGLKVVAPGTPEDAKGMLKSAIRSDDPIMFIEHATMYQTRGLPAGTPPELWNVENPDAVREVHRSYIEAGSQIVLTNSFGGSRTTLDRQGLADRVSELNKAAAENARAEADAAGASAPIEGAGDRPPGPACPLHRGPHRLPIPF